MNGRIQVTVTRAGNQTVASGGALFTVGANTGGVGPQGLQVFGAGTNLCLQSQTIASGSTPVSPWAVVSSGTNPTLTGNAAIAPDGTTTATLAAFPACTNQYSLIYQTFAATVAPYTLSFWARSVTGTGTLYFLIDDGTGGYVAKACSLTTTWARYTITRTTTAATWYMFFGPMNNSSGTAEPSPQPALNCYLWGVQLESGSSASPYVPTTTATVSWPATTVTTPRAITDGDNWAIGVIATPGCNWNASTSLLRHLWDGSTTGNLFYARVIGNGTLVLQAGNGADSYVTAPADNAQHQFVFAQSAGVLSIYVDGVQQAVTAQGAPFTAVLPDTFYLGSDISGANQLGGCISKFVQGRSYQEVSLKLNSQDDPYAGSGLAVFSENTTPDGTGKWPMIARPAGGALTVTNDGGFSWDPVRHTGSWVPANTPAVNSQGVWVGGASNNLVPHSDGSSGFVSNGGCARTGNSSLCPVAPDGVGHMDLYTLPIENSGWYWYYGGGAYTPSVWIARVTGDAPSTVHFSDAGTWKIPFDVPVLPTRITGLGGNREGIYVARCPGDTCTRIAIWGWQVEAGQIPPSLFHATTGSSYTGSATTISIPVVVGSLGTWFFGCKYTGYYDPAGFSWSGSALPLFYAGNGASTNSAYVSGQYFGVYDASGNQRYSAWTPPADNLQHTVVIGSQMGVLSMWSDGVPVSLSLAGAGTGVVTTFTPGILLGSNAIPNYFNGYIQKFVQGTTVQQVMAELA